MIEQKGYYREAVDIRFMEAGTIIQLANDVIAKVPRSGMYKVSTSLLLMEVMEDLPQPAFSEDEAKKMAENFERIKNQPPGKPLLLTDQRSDEEKTETSNVIQGPWIDKDEDEPA